MERIDKYNKLTLNNLKLLSKIDQYISKKYLNILDYDSELKINKKNDNILNYLFKVIVSKIGFKFIRK